MGIKEGIEQPMTITNEQLAKVDEAVLVITNDAYAYGRILDSLISSKYNVPNVINDCLCIISRDLYLYLQANKALHELALAIIEHYEEETGVSVLDVFPVDTGITASCNLCKEINQPKKVNNMTKLIESKTFVNGTNIAGMDTSEMYDAIVEAEAQVKHLESIENKPKKLVKEIVQRKKDIASLVVAIDKVK